MAIIPTLSAAFRPLLEFIDGYRRRVIAPSGSIVRKKGYAQYADMSYIYINLSLAETKAYKWIVAEK